jgi:hypothetical protein
MPEGWLKFSKIVKNFVKNISTLKYYDISVKFKQANDLSFAYLSSFKLTLNHVDLNLH